MSKKAYVYSNLSNNQNYTTWVKPMKGQEGAPNRKEKSVLINGQANVVNKSTMITPQGVLTIVSEEDMAVLEACPMFKRHLDAKFISVQDKEFKSNDVAKDLKKKDKSAPLTPADLKERGVDAKEV